MKLHKKVERKFFLELSKKELEAVKSLLQNPIGNVNPMDEIVDVCSLRTHLFEALSTEIPEHLSVDQQFTLSTYEHEELW